MPRDPSRVTPEMIRESEDKIGRMEAFKLGPDWALQRTVLESRAASLRARMDALVYRVGKPATYDDHGRRHDPPTAEEFARVAGAIEQNADLLRFPDLTLAMWRDQLTQMREALIREADA